MACNSRLRDSRNALATAAGGRCAAGLAGAARSGFGTGVRAWRAIEYQRVVASEVRNQARKVCRIEAIEVVG